MLLLAWKVAEELLHGLRHTVRDVVSVIYKLVGSDQQQIPAVSRRANVRAKGQKVMSEPDIVWVPWLVRDKW